MAVPGLGQQTTLTLSKCISLSLEQSPTLRSSRASQQSASAGVTGAFGQFLPSLGVAASYGKYLNQGSGLSTFGSSSGNAGLYGITGTAAYTLFNGFQNTASYERANRTYDAATSTLERTRQDIAFNVTQGFLNVLRTERIAKSREENLKISREQLDRVKALYEVGSVPQANVLQQETQAANDEVAWLQSKNDWYTAKNDLITLIGLDGSREYVFSDNDVPQTIPQDDRDRYRAKVGDVNAAITRTLQTRADVVALRARMAADESSITVARSGYWPSVSLSLSYAWENTSFAGFDSLGSTKFGVNLQVPIFDRLATRANVEEAEASSIITRSSYDELVLQVSAQVHKAYYDLDAAEQSLTATDRALQSAEENRRTAEERYKLGAANVLDFITAESQYLIASINAVNAVYSYLGARSEIEYETGTLIP